MQAVEIEVEGKRNEELHFRPLMRRIRGRFDFSRFANPNARALADTWTPIPGQRIAINEEGDGVIREPLHDVEHAALREKIQKQGMSLPPAEEVIDCPDLNSWLFYMKQAVDCGLAKLVAGKFPKIDEAKVRRNFLTAPGQEKPTSERLLEAFERNNELIAALLKKLSDE